MQTRTFFRIMLDNLFINNPLCRAFTALVKFCNEQSYYGGKTLKFSENNPFNNTDIFVECISRTEKYSTKSYKNKFIFNSGVNLK